MKQLLITAATLCAAAFSTPGAFAATAPTVVVWQGEAVIDTAQGCEPELSIGPAPGIIVKSVLRPLNVAQNGDNTTVTFLANQMAMFAMVLDGGAMPKGVAATFGNDASGNIQANVGIKYSGFRQTPKVISATTTDVALSGTIANFLYVKGCTITFRAAYRQRVN